MQRAHLLAVFSFTLATAGLHSAENPVASVQRALKDLGFYSAEPGGRLDEETRNALRCFQIRTGLKPTGEIDSATMQALATSSTSGADPAPQSVRERALRTEISDREFLANFEDRKHAEASAPRPVPAPLARPEPAVAPESAESRGSSDSGLRLREVAYFVESYLEAAEAPAPDHELSFYADYVDYFDSGRVSRQFVAKDQARYYQRWPKREFTLTGTPQLMSSHGRRATVRFRMQYKLSGQNRRASGATENVIELLEENGSLRIVGIQERKVSE